MFSPNVSFPLPSCAYLVGASTRARLPSAPWQTQARPVEGDRVRITTHLVDAEEGFERWSRSYDSDVESVLAVHGEIALAHAHSGAFDEAVGAANKAESLTPGDPLTTLSAATVYAIAGDTAAALSRLGLPREAYR